MKGAQRAGRMWTERLSGVCPSAAQPVQRLQGAPPQTESPAKGAWADRYHTLHWMIQEVEGSGSVAFGVTSGHWRSPCHSPAGERGRQLNQFGFGSSPPHLMWFICLFTAMCFAHPNSGTQQMDTERWGCFATALPRYKRLKHNKRTVLFVFHHPRG